MAKLKSIPIDLLLQSIRYDPDTGKLFWLERTPDMFGDTKRPKDLGCKIWNSRHAGSEAFTCADGGYKRGVVHNVRMRAHRVAYAIFYKRWPEGEIDHINGDGLDNRIANLRDVSRIENGKNRKLYRQNTSGTNGVTRQHDSWVVKISCIYVGRYKNLADAVAARKEAELKFGYHVNHGRFT